MGLDLKPEKTLMILDSFKKFNSRFAYNNTLTFGLLFSLNVTSICHESEYTDGSVIKKIDTVFRDFSQHHEDFLFRLPSSESPPI